jgi:uncharacterized protein (PEP-CTERM system associated)
MAVRASVNDHKQGTSISARECVSSTSWRSFAFFLGALLAFGGTSPVHAQRWTIEPSVQTQATLTNNANYDTGGQREGDLVLNILPAVTFSREGPQWRVFGSAALNLIGYVEGTQANRALPQANILANLEAIERVFFIDAALLANQEVLNPFLTQSDANSTFNKYTYVQGRISPYFQGDFATNWRYLVRSDNSYTLTTQTETDTALDDSYFGRHVAEIVRASTPLGGSLRVQSDVTRFTDARQSSQQLDSALATVNYAFTPQFTAGVRGGYERTNYTSGETSGPIYGVDLAWDPSPDTRLAGFWESRFFGPSYQFDFSNRQRRFATNLSFSRLFTVYPQLLFELPTTGNVASSLNAILTARFPDPVERARQVQDLIARQGLPSSLPGGVNIFSQSPNVVTSASGTFALIGVRNTLALTPYYLKTITLPDAAIPPTFINFNNNIQKGLSLSLSHRLSPVTSLNATASRLQTRGVAPAIPTITDQNILQIQANRQLTPRSTVFVGARYQNEDSTLNVPPKINEAAIFVGLFYQR